MVAGVGMLIPTAFLSLSIVFKKYMDNAARGLISRDVALYACCHFLDSKNVGIVHI